ncbi:hypothetical protein SAMN00120144_2008 [Hymenobacter roseosalivarius DSM 11622]|uniref:Uncharacterized protein n=1 Tax=Hymenobacter roseosalivarius DSM 11622 TaxID=645990 RepID=A0A1W1VMC9_9BACT|nr:DUF2314 domain-containing protein [Hymenobacter roseosalivarius]SMB94476.1 hypothetical protein SAMN00120144_2008 [Hymenobacter roseosalivarius DSM 11622]
MAQKLTTASLANNAPTDQPISLVGTEAGNELRAFDSLLAPAVKQARKTLPQAKKRFLLGLPSGESFFLTTHIFDTDGKFEQVFVRVTSWESNKVVGTIANDLVTVKQYQVNQSIEFPEKAALDWTIAKPDGSEEGNYVGKFIDALQK